jgi:hypothetical protein
LQKLSSDVSSETLGLCLCYFYVRRHTEFALQLTETPSLMASLMIGAFKRRLNRFFVAPSTAKDIFSALMRGLPRKDQPEVELRSVVECLLEVADDHTLECLNSSIDYMVSFI